MGAGAFLQGLTIFIVVVLVPLIPAWVLYRYLPSRTVVTGPFKGFQLKLTGAFAAYFVIALFGSGVIMYYIEPMRGDLSTRYVLRGEADLSEITRDEFDRRRLSVVMLPRGFDPDRVGAESIRWEISLRACSDPSGEIHWPYDEIQIDYPGYLPAQVRISDFERLGADVFRLSTPIVLERDPLGD